MYRANQVADYFLSRSDEDEGLSNLKLQKLLYYAQGFHLAINGARLFSDPIYAWAHGPVVLDMYHRFKGHGSAEIPKSETLNGPPLDAATQSLLDEVWQAYAQFSAWRLREMTHKEPPWLNTPQSTVIDESELRAYFSTQIETV